MTARTQAARTGANNAPPGVLLPGQFYVEMGQPLRLWTGVPTAVDATGRRLLLDSGTSAGGPYLALSGGTMTGPLILFGSPTQPNGAVTKAYADSNPPAGGPYLKLVGGALTGPLSVAGAVDVAGPVTAQTALSVNSPTPGNGAVHLSSGDTHPGRVGFNAPGGARVGYVGYGDGVNKLMLVAEAPYTGWRVTGTLETSGTLTASAGANIANTAGINATANQNAVLSMNGPTSQFKYIQSSTNGLTRWQVQLGNNAAESGGNAGSNLGITRFDDAGNFMGTALAIARATGDAAFSGSVVSGGDVYATNALRLTKGAYIHQTSDNALTQIVMDAAAWRWDYARVGGALTWRRGSDNATLFSIDGLGAVTVASSLATGGGIQTAYVRSTSGVMSDDGRFMVGNNPAYGIFRNGTTGTWSFNENGVENFTISGVGTVSSRGAMSVGGDVTAYGSVHAAQGNATFVAVAGGSYTTLSGATGWSDAASVRVAGGHLVFGDTAIVEFFWGTGRVFLCDEGGSIFIQGGGFKPGGGSWVDSSDARIKTVLGDYTKGLDEALRLRPVTYRYNGNDKPSAEGATMHADTEKEYVGFVAQEVQGVLPAMVTPRPGFIDDREVGDLLMLDTTALPCVLLNAIKTLHERVTNLESHHTGAIRAATH